MKKHQKPVSYLELSKVTPRNKEGQIHPSDLTNEEWEFIKGYMPFPAKTGRPRADYRDTMNGIMYFLSTAIRWEDMPKYYPSGSVCWNLLKELEELGVWTDILHDLQRKALDLGKLNLKNGYIDGSLAPSKKGIWIL